MNRQLHEQNLIGFPPGLLEEASRRIPVIYETSDWIALEKPVGIGVRKHPWNVGVPDMDTALNNQLKAGKPELLRHKAAFFGSIYYLEPKVSGISMFAKNREGLDRLRNQVGSESLQFLFLFVAKAGSTNGVHELTADEPLLAHNTKPKMIPSTAKGKKARTHFRLLYESGLGWALWEASASYIRPHQVRAHAATHGFSIMGDTLYAGPIAPSLNDFLLKKRSLVFCPVFKGIALHLYKVIVPIPDINSEKNVVTLLAKPPSHFQLMLQRMELTHAANTILGL